MTRPPAPTTAQTSKSTLLAPPTPARIATAGVLPTAASVDPPTRDDGGPWLVILLPTQMYSLDMQPVWVAEPGERYRIHAVDGGYVLGFWEYDLEPWFVWVVLDGSVAVFERAPARA